MLRKVVTLQTCEISLLPMCLHGLKRTSRLGLTREDDGRLSITFTPVNPFNIAINVWA